MPSSFLGIAISGLIAFIFLLVGLIGLVGKKGVGNSVRGYLGMIPIGNPKLWAALFIVFGIVFGGIGYATTGFSSLVSKTGTASLVGDNSNNLVSAADIDCTYNFLNSSTLGGNSNITFRTDPNNLKLRYADVKESGGAYSINGVLSCDRKTDNIREGQQVTCEIKGQSFRSETSTTDSNTYYITATSTSASKISGYPWAQTAYLADSGTGAAPATSSSDQEVTKLVFAQDEVNQKIGFLFTLPGNTPWSYLNNQSSRNVDIDCGGKTVGTVVVTKVSGVV